MRYVVLGAGAVGGTIGGRLADAGHDVVLLARGAHAEAMRRDGLRLAMPDRTITVRPLIVTAAAELPLRDDDVLLLTTKTQHTMAVLDELPAGATRLPIVCVQNGVANERMAMRRFRDVRACVVMLPAVLLEPRRIDAQGTPCSGLLDVGRYPSGTDAATTLIAAHLAASGFVSQATADVMRWKYAKLLRNLANAVEVLCGQELDTEERATVDLLVAEAKDEALRCYAAAGIDHASDEEWLGRRGKKVEWAPVEGRQRGGGSSWQSVVRGAGNVEVDYLNGEIVLLGRLHGVPTPVNEQLQHLTNDMARRRGRPGDIRPRELLAAVRSVAAAS